MNVHRFESWWLGRARWQQLALFGAYVFGWWLIFLGHDSHRDDPIDTALLIFLATTFALACIVMTWGQQTWTMRALGILGTLAGDMVLYGSAGIRRAIDLGPMPEWISDLTRAFFFAGVPLLAIGLIRWVIYRREVSES